MRARIPASLVCATVVVIAMVTALSLPKKTTATTTPIKQSSASVNPSLALTVAKKTYAQIINVSDGDKTGEGSAVCMGEHVLLSCFHVIEPESVAVHKYKLTVPKQYAVEIAHIHQFYDLVLLKTDATCSEKVKLASSVSIGEELVDFSNALGSDGMEGHYHVVKVVGPYLFFREIAFPGESGSGLFNAQGELVGIMQKVIPENFKFGGKDYEVPVLSRATSYVAIREFFTSILSSK